MTGVSGFAYEPRDECVCGESLLDTTVSIKKTFPQGVVRFARCPCCGSWCQSPQLTVQSLAGWYDSDDYQGSATHRGAIYVNYLADEEHRAKEAVHRYNRDLTGLLRPGSRVLEVGCATGSILAVVRSHGHEVVGVDLSARFVASAKSLYGLDILLGNVMDAGLEPQSFDAILMFGTLSNLRDAPAHFRFLHGLLKPSGLLVFNFADAGSWIARLYGSRYWMFTPAANAFVTAPGCEQLLRRTGFDLRAMRGDAQVPSFQKLCRHAKLGFAIPVLKALGLEHGSLPWATPIPGVRFAVGSRT